MVDRLCKQSHNHAVLLVSCQDQKGITAALTQFVFQHNGNIVHADQHIDDDTKTFFMRLEWDLDGFAVPRHELAAAIEPLVKKFNMQWQLRFMDVPARVAVMVSRQLHCVYDLLFRFHTGDFHGSITCVISNHSHAQEVAEFYQVPFHHIPVSTDTKAEAEEKQLAILTEAAVDWIVLARYHQILSDRFVARYPQRIINIHHSFLPAFPGAQPYHRAFARGVKIIGATSHFVTEELDEGPIIEQDTIRVNHRDSVETMVRKGRDLERVVLARALGWVLEHRVLCYHDKTVVFD